MTTLTRIGMSAAALALLVLLGLGSATGGASGRSLAAIVAASEAWRLGVTSEGEPAYTATQGRLASAAASLRSNRDVTDIYYLFPAPAHTVSVRSAALQILQRSGSYAGNATLALEVRGLDGSLRHTTSASPIDLQSATIDTWLDLTLTADTAALTIEPGEYLAFHFALSGAAGGDLDVRPIFEVVVAGNVASNSTPTATVQPTATPRRNYLPVIRK